MLLIQHITLKTDVCLLPLGYSCIQPVLVEVVGASQERISTHKPARHQRNILEPPGGRRWSGITALVTIHAISEEDPWTILCVESSVVFENHWNLEVVSHPYGDLLAVVLFELV